MKKQLLADLTLLAVVIVWGYTFVAIKDALAGISPFCFIAVRFIIATLFLLLLFRKKLKELDIRTLVGGLVVGIFLFMAYAFQTVGLMYTTASNAGFITGFSVVLVPLFSAVIFRERPNAGNIAGVMCATVGLFFLSFSSFGDINRGDVFVFFCALAVAFHILTVGYYTRRVDSILLTIVQIGVVAVLSTLSALVFEKPEVPGGVIVWRALLVTSLFATVGAYLAQNIMQRFTSSTHTALIFSGEPVFAGIFGFWFLGERLGGVQVTGCLLILAGMVISEVKMKREKDDTLL